MAFLFIATAISLFSQNKVVETFPFEKNKSIQAIEQSLFTEIPDASSGLLFKLPLDKKGVRELDSNPFFVTRKQAIGVCAGDFDHDGLDDVFFAHSYGGHQ